MFLVLQTRKHSLQKSSVYEISMVRTFRLGGNIKVQMTIDMY